MLIVSIILEAAVAVIAVLAAMQGRPYLYGLVFTFAAYVLMISLVCCNGPSKERCSRDYSCSRPSRRSSRFGRCTGKAGRASGKFDYSVIQIRAARHCIGRDRIASISRPPIPVTIVANSQHRRDPMTKGPSLPLAELEQRIAIARDNIRQLIEQAAAQSGAEDEDRNADRIAQQQEELDRLIKQRDQLLKK